MSGKWNGLDRNTQRYIATIAAGARQQSRFIAMMDNYERTMELVDVAYDSAGKSSEQFTKYQDTLEYKLNQLSNTWEQFRTRFFNSEFFKNIIDGLNEILGKITELSGGQLLSLGAAFIVLGKTFVMNLISGAQTGLKKLGELISNKVQGAFNKVGKVQHYQIQVDTRKEQIKQLEQKLATLKNQKIEFESENKDVLNDLKKIQEEIKKAKEEGRELEFGDNVPDQELIDRARELDVIDSQIEEIAGNVNEQQDLLGNEETQLVEAQQRGQILGQTLATSMSAAIVAVTTQDNPMTAVGTVLAAGISGLLPTILPAIGTVVTAFKTGGLAAGKGALEGFITGTAGIGLIIVAITAALTGLLVLAKNASKAKEASKLTNQIDALNDKIKETEEKVQQVKSSLKDLSQTEETLESLKEKWEELGSKQVLTTEEQEEYNSLVKQIKNEYPELITYYDEENNKMQISLEILDKKIEKQNELIKKEQQLLNLQQRQLNSQTYSRDVKQTYKDLTKKGRLFEYYSADLTEEQFESAFKGLSGDFAFNLDYNYTSGHGIAEQFFEDKFLEEGSKQYMTGKAGEIATDYMRIAEVARTQDISVEEALNLDDKSLNIYLSEAGYGTYVKNENGEYTLNAEEQTESIKNNVDALKEFNEQVLNATAAMKQVEAENFERQADLNAEIVAQELGIDADGAAANIIGAQAAALTSKMDAVTLTGEGNGVAAGLDDLNDAMGDYADDIEFTVDEFKTLSDGVTQGHWAGANWENISSSQRDNLKLLGIDADIWKNEYQDLDDEELSKKLAEAYSDYAQNAIVAIIGEEQEEKAKELNEAFTGLYSEIPEMTIEKLNEKKEEFKAQYSEGLNDEQWEQTWNEMTNNDVLSAAIENLAASGLEQQIIDSLSTSSVQYFSGMLDGLSLTDFGRSGITDAIEQVSENYELSNKQLETLMSIDLSQGYHEIQRNSQTYIDALMKSGMSLSEATEAFNDYINNIGSILGNAVLGKEGALVVKDMLQEDIKIFKSQYEPLIEARNEMLENEGAISSDTYFSLIEAGFEDYVKVTTSGYELIADKAEEAWAVQAMAPLEELREDIKLNKQLLNDAQKMSEEDWTVTYWEGNSDMSISSVDSAISQYIENEKKFEGATEQLTDAQKRYIEVIVAAGYSTEEEYIQALQEGAAALKNMEPDTWIQGLVNLREASVDAQEEVKNLKDELTDLNEQLIEDQKAADEAAQALHEAKFGTEDFQSGLDGLINYERPLELVNKQLENLKENLTDVSNVEDASAAMDQVADLYEDKMAILQAEGKVIDQSLANIRQELLANYGNYISFDENGVAKVDFSYEDMQDSDIIKTDGLEKLIEEYNSTYDMALDKEQEYFDAQKEFDELKSEARDKYITMEQNVIDIIKEQMQEEIDAVTDKYAALEEADNNYLDALREAIDKQRKLRDQENQYEDLATKEKKLALMQRDTSGTNRKEAMSLEKEVEENRQNLLDNEVDRLIESMQEMYEKQAEAHQLEIEVAEATMEDIQLLNSMIQTEMSQFSSADDYKAWLMENDPAVADMTDAQLESYLEEADSLFSGYAQYVALTTEELALRTDVINQKADEMFVNTEENITNIGTVIQDSAQKASEEAITSAQEAYDSAVEKMNDTQEKIAETKLELEKAEASAASLHGATMDEMVLASQSAMAEVSTYATKQLADMLGYDLSDDENIAEFAEAYNFVNDRGEITSNLYNAIKDAGGDISQYKMASQRYEVYDVSGSGNKTSFGYYETPEAAEAAYNQLIAQGHDADTLHWNGAGGYASGTFDDSEVKQHGILWPDKSVSYFNTMQEAVDSIKDYFTLSPHNATDGNRKTWAQDGNYQIFKTGGLVNYTGPAWVDGTPTKPEAFLSAEDTARIGEAARLLAQLPIFNSTSNAKNATSTNIGDTSIEIHINVEKIDSDYDVDQMIERVKQDIVDVSKPIGSSVILKK